MAVRRAVMMALGGGALLASCISTREVLRPGDAGTPAADAPFVPVLGLSAGVDHTCTVDDGLVRCTGSNRTLALGQSDGLDRLALEVVPRIADAVAVGATYESTCALRATGRLACFGGNARAQLGTGDRLTRSAPTDVLLPEPVASFSAGFDHVCAVLRSGALYCWGSNGENELGQGEALPTDRAIPVEVAPGVGFVEASSGQGHTCAIAVDGSLYCMGRNSEGELGLGASGAPRVTTPTRVGARRYAHVAAGQNHTCAISADTDAGALYCWGIDADNDGYEGPLDLPGSEIHRDPVRIGTASDWTAISTDTFHTCGLRGGGELWCWGRNAEGQLGQGSMDVVAGAVRLEVGSTFSAVDVGRFHTCARRSDGAVMCAGKNGLGELGTGDTDRRAVLTAID